MKKSFLLLTLVVGVATSGFARNQNGGTHQRASAGAHMSQGQGTGSHGYQGQRQSMSGSHQMGGNGNMGQGNQGQMSQNHHGHGNGDTMGNSTSGMNGKNPSSGMAQGQSGNSQQP